MGGARQRPVPEASGPGVNAAVFACLALPSPRWSAATLRPGRPGATPNPSASTSWICTSCLFWHLPEAAHAPLRPFPCPGCRVATGCWPRARCPAHGECSVRVRNERGGPNVAEAALCPEAKSSWCGLPGPGFPWVRCPLWGLGEFGASQPEPLSANGDSLTAAPVAPAHSGKELALRTQGLQTHRGPAPRTGSPAPLHASAHPAGLRLIR